MLCTLYFEFSLPTILNPSHYWVFDPDSRTAEMFELDDDIYRKAGALKEHDRLKPALFPGLTIRLDDIW